jgi:hypothetical protein
MSGKPDKSAQAQGNITASDNNDDSTLYWNTIVECDTCQSEDKEVSAPHTGKVRAQVDDMVYLTV